MKKTLRNILTGVVGSTLAMGLWSCSAENPFDSEGTGNVHLHTVVNSITTRALDSDYKQYLEDNCVVYISSKVSATEGKLIFKEKGLANVPSNIVLKTGNYAAEAWSGDSVTASFDKMFFRAYQEFNVAKGETSQVVLNCRIQNVVVSVNTNTIDPNLMKDDYTVTVKNTRGELTFDKNNAESARGYFMMPNNDNNLEISIQGTRKDGQAFTKAYTIENVKRAHHYILNFKYDPAGGGNEMGAVFLQLYIKDENLNDTQNVTVPTGPTISGLEFDIQKQQVFTDNNAIPENGLSLKTCAFGKGYKKITISTDSYAELGLPNQSFNILGLSDTYISQCNNAGLSWTETEYRPATNVSTMFLTLSKEMLGKLSAKSSEHVINVTVTDNEDYTSTASVRIARTEDAIVVEDPIVVEAIDVNKDLMAVGATTATITYSMADGLEGTPGVEYRKLGDTDWTFAAANGSDTRSRGPLRAPKQQTTLTGLEAGTNYQYRACCGDFHGSDIFTFTTESKFAFPNSSFEQWSTYSASTMLGTKSVILPGDTGNKSTSFWGSGNEGGATANKVLTDKSTDMVHSGTYSVKLASQSALGIIAAGNLFIGEYVRTDGTNGVLSLGREYNGSHPRKCAYTPTTDPVTDAPSSRAIPQTKWKSPRGHRPGTDLHRPHG